MKSKIKLRKVYGPGNYELTGEIAEREFNHKDLDYMLEFILGTDEFVSTQKINSDTHHTLDDLYYFMAVLELLTHGEITTEDNCTVTLESKIDKTHRKIYKELLALLISVSNQF